MLRNVNRNLGVSVHNESFINDKVDDTEPSSSFIETSGDPWFLQEIEDGTFSELEAAARMNSLYLNTLTRNATELDLPMFLEDDDSDGQGEGKKDVFSEVKQPIHGVVIGAVDTNNSTTHQGSIADGADEHHDHANTLREDSDLRLQLQQKTEELVTMRAELSFMKTNLEAAQETISSLSNDKDKSEARCQKLMDTTVMLSDLVTKMKEEATSQHQQHHLFQHQQRDQRHSSINDIQGDTVRGEVVDPSEHAELKATVKVLVAKLKRLRAQHRSPTSDTCSVHDDGSYLSDRHIYDEHIYDVAAHRRQSQQRREQTQQRHRVRQAVSPPTSPVLKTSQLQGSPMLLTFPDLIVLSTPLSNSLGLTSGSNVTICLTDAHITIIDESGLIKTTWPHAHIKRFGNEGTMCSLEMGDLCDAPGILYLNGGKQLFWALLQLLKHGRR
eukprot:m.116442 g.116442  ORF g.116442 m.116442 type:complete len:442 (-) comp28502_c0_seq1:24-1349(-)